jgi:signal transduction histidine kinase/CheY-like chemotaxis protein
MSLRAFIALISTVVVGGILALLYVETEQVLSRLFRDLDQAHVATVASTAEAIVKTHVYRLRTYRGLLENDQSLSSQFLISKTRGKPGAVASTLRRIEKDLAVDRLDILPTPMQISQITVTNDSGQGWLVSRSPLRNFGESIGTLVIGYRLGGEMTEEIARTTSTGAVLRASAPDAANPFPNRRVHLLIASEASETPLSVDLDVESRFMTALSRHTRRNLALVAGGSLLLLLLTLYGLLEFGFVRRFKQLLANIQSVARGLDRGTVEIPATTSHAIREVNDLSISFSKFSESLVAYSERIKEASKQAVRAEVAEQVAHDLKSPLAALDMLVSDATVLAKDPARAGKCVERIKDIVQTLSRSAAVDHVTSATTRLSPLLDAIIAEKRIQYQARANLTITVKGMPPYGCASNLPPAELKRTLSNLIDNAVEAIIEAGTITVSLESVGREIRFTIADDGRGIPDNIWERLGERGFSYGKARGSGLGLWSAIQFAKAHGGSLTWEARRPGGTLVSLMLPASPIPAWLTPELVLDEGMALAIVDDDPAILLLWEERLSKLEFAPTLFSFTDSESFALWTASRARGSFHLVCDYDMPRENGLDLISRCGLAAQATLVTSHADQPAVIEKAQALGVSILPKDAVAAIPIRRNVRRRGEIA